MLPKNYKTLKSFYYYFSPKQPYPHGIFKICSPSKNSSLLTSKLRCQLLVNLTQTHHTSLSQDINFSKLCPLSNILLIILSRVSVATHVFSQDLCFPVEPRSRSPSTRMVLVTNTICHSTRVINLWIRSAWDGCFIWRMLWAAWATLQPWSCCNPGWGHATLVEATVAARHIHLVRVFIRGSVSASEEGPHRDPIGVSWQ